MDRKVLRGIVTVGYPAEDGVSNFRLFPPKGEIND
jgi:hypothetical protein